MSRLTWSRLTVLLVALGALALGSCLQDLNECTTCPGINSSRIELQVPQFGLLDSVQFQVDGSALVSVKRNRSYAFENLSAGTREVTVIRWLSTDGGLSRTSTLYIQLDRGETRIILFHNDFPLVTWAPAPDAGALARLAPRMG